MKQVILCVFGDALLYLALLIIVMAGVRAFGQTVVLKAVVRDGQIFLVPYQQVEIRVRTKDGSALPKTGESLHCKPKNEVLGEAKRRGLDVNELVKALEDESSVLDKFTAQSIVKNTEIRCPIHFIGVIR